VTFSGTLHESTVGWCVSSAKAGGGGEGRLGVRGAVHDAVSRHGTNGRHHPSSTLAPQNGRRRQVWCADVELGVQLPNSFQEGAYIGSVADTGRGQGGGAVAPGGTFGGVALKLTVRTFLIMKIYVLWSARNGKITCLQWNQRTCLRVVLPIDTFVLDFHLQLSFVLCRNYIRVRQRSIKYYTIEAGGKNVTYPRAARTAG